jgi:hypothetical protein
MYVPGSLGLSAIARPSYGTGALRQISSGKWWGKQPPYNYNISRFSYIRCYTKLQVRHILFNKIVFLIFLNNPVTVHCARAYYLERKKQ